MAKVMVVMDGQTVDYSLIVNLLRTGCDVSWASDPAMAGLMARVSPPDAFVVDGRTSARPVERIKADLRAECDSRELPTIPLVRDEGESALEVKFDMRQGDRDRMSSRQLADVARACAAALVGVFVTSLGRGLAPSGSAA
jgi:hypothetical protein